MSREVFELIKWWFYWYPFRFLIQRIPLRVSYKLVDMIAPVLYVFSGEDKRRIEQGLSMMYRRDISERRKKEIVKDTFRNRIYTTIEVLWYPKLTKEMCENIFTIKGLENLEDALKIGKGVVLLHGHFGSPHLIIAALGFRGYKINQLGSRNPPDKIHGLLGKILNKIRMDAYKAKMGYKEKLPGNFIYTDLFMREVFRRLNNNEIIATGMDGREGTEWIEVDFLGGKAIFYIGTMKLIMRAKPMVLPAFHIRNRDHTHKVVIEKPIALEVTGEEEMDILGNIKNFLDIFENYIYGYPDHYARVFCLKQPFFVSPLRRT